MVDTDLGGYTKDERARLGEIRALQRALSREKSKIHDRAKKRRKRALAE